MPAGIWEDIWTKSLLARVYRFITQFRFRMTRDKVTLLMDESDNLCRRLHQCCVACRCFKRCHWQTSSKLCWRIWMLGSEDDRFLLASVSFTLYLSLLTFPFPSSRFFCVCVERQTCLWNCTCDKMSVGCFPFTTTLLCSSELEAVTQEWRNNTQENDINSPWS